MPPARVTRRAVTDENAENVGTTRLTRAKAAAIDNTAGDPPKKALGTKRTTTTTTTTNTAAAGRKRAALGDVSNVAKNDNVEEVDGKKGALSKNGLTAKTTKPAAAPKQLARTTSTRPVLVSKPTNASQGLKRPASGTAAVDNVVKKRNTSASKPSFIDEHDKEASENDPPSNNETKPSLEKKPKTASSKATKREKEALDEEDALAHLRPAAIDLDKDDLDDPLMVAEYVHEIFDYMKQLEIATMPNPDYMDNQSDLEWKMRGILVDWLLEVHTRFRLLPETLFLAVNIIDRFLSCKVVQLDRLQLVGVTAMFIASKYEEVLSPHVQNFVHVADDGFSDTEILSAERFVLTALDYDLSYPNPMNFLRRISKADNYDIQTRTLGKYLLEISCLDHRFLKYPPSHVAAAAMYLARLALERGEWDATLAIYAGYTEEQILPVFRLMVEYLAGPVVHDAFFRKYASKKFLKASIVLRQWAKKHAPEYVPGFASQPLLSNGKAARS